MRSGQNKLSQASWSVQNFRKDHFHVLPCWNCACPLLDSAPVPAPPPLPGFWLPTTKKWGAFWDEPWFPWPESKENVRHFKRLSMRFWNWNQTHWKPLTALIYVSPRICCCCCCTYLSPKIRCFFVPCCCCCTCALAAPDTRRSSFPVLSMVAILRESWKQPQRF